jgi:hypothetical protein
MTHPFMRLHLSLLPALIFPLAAQDPWEALLAGTRAGGLEAQRPWTLYHREKVGRSALMSELLMPARALGDLQRYHAGAEAMSALGQKLDVNPAPEWALVDPQGRVQVHGHGDLDARTLREAMEAGGWQPRWEQRKTFLRENPDHGDAVLDAVSEVGRRFFWLRVMVESKRQKGPSFQISGSPGDPIDPWITQALATPFAEREVVQPCAEAMTWFRALPLEDPEKAQAWTPFWSLGMGGVQASPELMEVLRGQLQDVEAQLRREPTRENLWSVWSGLAGFFPEANAESLVSTLEPAPGSEWPTLSVARALVRRLEPEKKLERAEAELSGSGDAQARLKAWGQVKLDALLSLKRYDDARKWILQARRNHRGAFDDHALEWTLDDKDEHLPQLQAALHAEVDELPRAGHQALMLVMLGRPAWEGVFRELGRHPALDPWSRGGTLSPGELVIYVPTPEQEAAFRKSHALPEGARWLLLGQDEAVLAQGTEAPQPAHVADLLRAASPPLLEKLEAFLRAHPDHREAQVKLVELLSGRMPHPRLELKLAQACAALGEAELLRRTEDFKPQLPLWEAVAKRTLPRVEARLHRWPESLDAWMAWMDWQSVLARPASPAVQMRQLAIWKSMNGGGCGPLPLAVATGVALRLEQAKRWKELADWGLAQWEGGWRKAMGSGRAGVEIERREVLESVQTIRKDLVTLAVTTIRGLKLSGRKGEALQLEEDLKGGDSSLWAEVGREKR